MRLNEVSYTDAKPIDGYGPGFFRIGGEVIQGGALVLPTGTSAWAGYDDTAQILALAGHIDVLFVARGAKLRIFRMHFAMRWKRFQLVSKRWPRLRQRVPIMCCLAKGDALVRRCCRPSPCSLSTMSPVPAVVFRFWKP